MWVLAFFKDSSGPKTGLTPSITVRKVSDGLAAASGSMVEIGDGFYRYSFSRDTSLDYVVLCDGGEALATEDRYAVAEISANIGEYTAALAGIESDVEDVYAQVTNTALFKADVSDIPTSGEMDTKLAAAVESIVGAASEATLKSITTTLTTISAIAGVILAIEKGDWVIDADNKQLVYTDADTDVEIVRFNMQDVDGTPSITSMFKRIRV